MSIFNRIKYSAFLAVVIGMVVGLVASIVGLDAIELLGHPVFVLATALFAFIASPWLARRMPFKR